MTLLDSVFVFDTDQVSGTAKPSDEDVQDAKLLYYYPEYRPVHEKRAHFGLVEGLVSFVSDYTNEGIECIKSKLYTTVIYKWVANIFLVSVFKSEKVQLPEVQQYGESWMNTLYKNVLETTTQTFRLLHGDISEYLKPKNNQRIEQLKSIFNEFLPDYINVATRHSLHVLRDVNICKYATTSASSTIDIQLFVDDLAREFESIQGYIIINDGELVHTCLDHDDMLVIYSYLVRYGDFVHLDVLNVTENSADSVKSSVVILKDKNNAPIGQRIYLKGRCYKLGALRCKTLVLVILLSQEEDLLFIINGIKEYVSNKPFGIQYLQDKLGHGIKRNDKCISINRATDSYKSVGFNVLDKKALAQLSIIFGMHVIFSNVNKRATAVQYRDPSVGWINARVANQREIYHVDTNGKSSQSENHGKFWDAYIYV